MTRHERAKRNQTIFREANEQIEQSRQRLALDRQPSPFVCECRRETCTTVVLIPPDVYELARAAERRFLVAAGHEDDEAIVGRGDGYAIVEKDSGPEGTWTSG